MALRKATISAIHTRKGTPFLVVKSLHASGFQTRLSPTAIGRTARPFHPDQDGSNEEVAVEAADPRPTPTPTDDEARLAELGYKQELNRGWSAFTNFATRYDHLGTRRDLYGVPVRVAERRPDRRLDRLAGALCLRDDGGLLDGRADFEVPDRRGPDRWAYDLGGKGWSWMTGWFNIVGLVGIVASVAYGAALFLNATLGLYGLDVFGLNFGDYAHILGETWLLFVLICLLHRGQRLRRPVPGVDEQHLGRLAPARGGGDPRILAVVPDGHQGFGFVFGERINNSGLHDGSTSKLRLLVPRAADRLPADDVHADRLRRVRPHRRGDPRGGHQAAQGVWCSVFFSALIGWFVLLGFLFAATDVERGQRRRR